jgi:hypothetical protein
MNGLERRERALEAAFEANEEIHFKILTRAVRLFGEWAAVQMSIAGKEIKAYGDVCVDLCMSRTGHLDVIAKVEKDFREKGLSHSHHRLEHEMEGFYQEIRRDLMGATKA